MATILRGKRKGEQVVIHQFCNDWFTDDDGKVWNPSSLEFTPEEVMEITYADMNGQCGIMFWLYELDASTGRMKKVG